jgi:recombination protein RecT
VPEAKISPQGSGIKKMKTQIEKSENLPLKDFLKQDYVIKEFAKLVQDPTNFIMSAITTIQQNKDFPPDVDRNSVLFGLMNAAILKLPINNNFGLAYLIPYKENKTNKVVAQFQVGYLGFVNLAIRSGIVKTIAATEVYDGQIKKWDPLHGYEFDFSPSARKSNHIIAYVAYIQLINGYEKYELMTYEEMQAFKRKYSKAFQNNSGPWITNDLEMSKKTVIKRILKRNPINDFFVNRALQTDQAVIVGENEFIYIDNANDDDVVGEVVTKENKEGKKTTKKTTAKPEPEPSIDQNTDNEVVTEQSNVTTDVDNEIDDTEIPF